MLTSRSGSPSSDAHAGIRPRTGRSPVARLRSVSSRSTSSKWSRTKASAIPSASPNTNDTPSALNQSVPIGLVGTAAGVMSALKPVSASAEVPSSVLRRITWASCDCRACRRICSDSSSGVTSGAATSPGSSSASSPVPDVSCAASAPRATASAISASSAASSPRSSVARCSSSACTSATDAIASCRRCSMNAVANASAMRAAAAGSVSVASKRSSWVPSTVLTSTCERRTPGSSRPSRSAASSATAREPAAAISASPMTPRGLSSSPSEMSCVVRTRSSCSSARARYCGVWTRNATSPSTVATSVTTAIRRPCWRMTWT